MELENIVANTVYLKAREGASTQHSFLFFVSRVEILRPRGCIGLLLLTA